jgi:hypothetical protein
LPEAGNAYNSGLKVVDIEQWIIVVTQSRDENPGETSEPPSPTPEIEAMDHTTTVHQEETQCEPPQEMPASVEQFWLSADPEPKSTVQRRKARAIIEEQLAFDFSML